MAPKYFIWILLCLSQCARAASTNVLFSGDRPLNTLVSELLVVSSISNSTQSFTFNRAREGWIWVRATTEGGGILDVTLDPGTAKTSNLIKGDGSRPQWEAVRFLSKGNHLLMAQCGGQLAIKTLVVRAIPELVHCGLGFNPEIKTYGTYDFAFLSNDVLPNITTLIVPGNIVLSNSQIDFWHQQGKRFIGETGLNAQASGADDHVAFWNKSFDQAPFLDGIIIDEFIVNNLLARPGIPLTAEQTRRLQQEQQQHEVYAQAIKQITAAHVHDGKLFYAYFGGSGKKLNQEMIGTNFVKALVESGCHIALERYLHEMSSGQKSQEALEAFVEGIADWQAKEPGVIPQMVIAFGLFSMPSGSLNKQPDVDYHVWMDQQMNLVANDPTFTHLGGLEWWTSSLADEETVRFVGKLYRHYAIEGRTNRLTRDPLILSHIVNPDFQAGSDGWTLEPAEPGTIQTRSFPRYGRIEGRFMGLWRPADPEHIGDTFLWMKRSQKGPNRVSQTIKHLEPGRLYSLKIMSCDFGDLVNPKTKKREEATGFIGAVTLEGAEMDEKRSFNEMYASTPEPKTPIWITYHWKEFRAKSTEAKLTVSDWPPGASAAPFGQEQIFNFIELQPYHE